MLTQMGVSELIAGNKSDYVDISVELGNDRNFYSEIQRKIEKTCSMIKRQYANSKNFSRALPQTTANVLEVNELKVFVV